MAAPNASVTMVDRATGSSTTGTARGLRKAPPMTSINSATAKATVDITSLRRPLVASARSLYSARVMAFIFGW